MELSHNISKSLQSELKRNAAELLQASLKKCDTSKSYRHIAVHDIRKNLKKIRALLRMIRYGIGEDVYKENNKWFRDTGKIISDIRDASSYLEILDKLQQRNSTNIKPQFFNEIRTQLKSYRRKLSRQTFTNEQAFITIEQRLTVGIKMVNKWPLKNLELRYLTESIQQVYECGYHARQKAMENPTSENYHQWRKRVKYLMYQLRFLEPVWPNNMSSSDEELQMLSDYLGEDHDLAILKDAAESEIITFQSEQDLSLFSSIVEEYSKALREMVHPLGMLIYAETPKAYSQRIKTYLQVNKLF